ncbi:MAG: preprotein translocase subunit YajC [Verrucomicrobiota bacterium]|jgi:preprotein translocase subunit YajC|nr:MAG: preprotein translocase subunit YajC [Verrucomicrobiota bacterium]
MSLFTNTPFIAQSSAAPAAPGGGSFQLLFFGFLIAAMYFLMIAPQRKKQKQHEEMLKAIKSGDQILTSAGIFGTITNVKDDRFIVRISDETKIEIAKGFVQSVITKPDTEETK